MSTEQPTPETDAVINGILERAKPYTVHIYVEMVDKMKSIERQRDATRAEAKFWESAATVSGKGCNKISAALEMVTYELTELQRDLMRSGLKSYSMFVGHVLDEINKKLDK